MPYPDVTDPNHILPLELWAGLLGGSSVLLREGEIITGLQCLTTKPRGPLFSYNVRNLEGFSKPCQKLSNFPPNRMGFFSG